MKVIYSSKSGNTKKLAEHIASSLGVSAVPASEAGNLRECNEPIALGFWCDKGQIDEGAKALLPQLYGKQVALFYTAGLEKSHEYVAQMNAQFASELRAAGASVIADVFMSQGAISEEIISAMRAMAAANPNDHAITPEKEARWAEAKKHPSEEDLAAAAKWAAGLQKAAEHLAGALAHMNDDHLDATEELVRAHAKTTGAGAKLIGIDYEALIIEHETGLLVLPYLTPAREPKQLHMSVIELCKAAAPKQCEPSKQEADMLAFRRGFASCVVASILPNGQPLASYAPVIEHDGKLYIFISEVADHYEALSHNANASVMFVQDEAAAAMVFARVRLRYDVRAVILPREDEAANEPLFAALAAAHPAAGVGMFKAMKDFHFVRLDIKGGRYVKGFGAAFDVDENGRPQQVRVNNPHKRG